MTKDELIAGAKACLAGVEDGTITVAPAKDDWERAHCGNVEFHLSNGWTVTVFNDVGEWDYVDSFRAPDGTYLDYKTIDTIEELGDYRPSDFAKWTLDDEVAY